MKVTVKLFAAAKDIAARSEIEVEVGENADVAALKQAISDALPTLKDLLARSHVAVDQQYAGNAIKLAPNQEIALIPPVSGG